MGHLQEILEDAGVVFVPADETAGVASGYGSQKADRCGGSRLGFESTDYVWGEILSAPTPVSSETAPPMRAQGRASRGGSIADRAPA
ncbi:hypothetical protein AUC71_04240 [Methyloceanibacter marginalis]|uniref:Uncharacterized protein n=1 Tax=Methyloceanibacter marginalis TaxID=1774971 RepID=A0A1E3VTD4_9HYPH|nr:hypothetical protein AUC71_04240 [Methyloceanibacter marginalis]